MYQSTERGRGLVAIGVLASLALAAYFAALGFNGIWTPNEGFYADAARQMLATNNFLWAFKEKRTWPLFFSYVSFGLAVLTKGYPYFVVIELIIFIYLFADAWMGDHEWAKRVRFLRLAR